MKVAILGFLLVPLFYMINTPDETLIEIFEEPQCLKIESTLNKGKCNNKAFIPLELPQNTKGFIYTLAAVSKLECSGTERELYDKAMELNQKYETSKIPDFISPHDSQRTFNYYLIKGKENVDAFNNCGYYKYKEKYIDTKSRNAYIEIEDTDSYYIAIENNVDLKGLRVVVEVVALVEK